MSVIGASGLSVNIYKWNAQFSKMIGRSSEDITLNLELDNITLSLNKIFKQN